MTEAVPCSSNTCPDCQLAASRPTCSTYRLRCLQCCTRLVCTASPSKEQAASLLSAIALIPGSPGRAEILESVRRSRARHP